MEYRIKFIGGAYLLPTTYNGDDRNKFDEIPDFICVVRQ